MKKLFFVVFLMTSVSVGLAQKPNPTVLQSLTENEQAFSRMSEEKGTRDSFMAFIAEDGILFRPWAVRGKQWMIDHPLPPSDKRSLLAWQPIFADVAQAGDMGYTTGPWQFKTNINDAKPVAFGNFITVWKKQADGSWKFAVDLGISNPQPAQTNGTGEPAVEYAAGIGQRSDPGQQRAALLARERALSTAAAKAGARKIFASFADPQVRLFREDKFPFVGREAAIEALSSTSIWTWQPLFVNVSRSGDLAYTYGTYRLETKGASAPAETGNYLRIWKRKNGAWKLMVDVANPVPPETKKN